MKTGEREKLDDDDRNPAEHVRQDDQKQSSPNRPQLSLGCPDSSRIQPGVAASPALALTARHATALARPRVCSNVLPRSSHAHAHQRVAHRDHQHRSQIHSYEHRGGILPSRRVGVVDVQRHADTVVPVESVQGDRRSCHQDTCDPHRHNHGSSPSHAQAWRPIGPADGQATLHRHGYQQKN